MRMRLNTRGRIPGVREGGGLFTHGCGLPGRPLPYGRGSVAHRRVGAGPVSIVAAAVALTLSVAAHAGDEAAVNQLLDRIERSWANHDMTLYDEQCIDKDLLAIITPTAGPKSGPLVFGKDRFLNRIEQLWKRGTVAEYKLRNRQITVTDDIAWIEHTVVMKLKGRPNQATPVANIALRREKGWRMCFSMPRFTQTVVLVEEVPPGSIAEHTGLKPGDVVGRYAGRRPTGSRALLRAMNTDGAATADVELEVIRGQERLRFKTSPGEIGVRCADRLLPTAGAMLIQAGEPHAVKNIPQLTLQAFKRNKVEEWIRHLTPEGYLSIEPARAGFPIITTHANLREQWAKEFPQLEQAFDLSTVRLENVRAIVAGDVAIVSCWAAGMRRGDTPEKVRFPTRLQVHVHRDGEWRHAATLPVTTQMGLQLHGTP